MKRKWLSAMIPVYLVALVVCVLIAGFGSNAATAFVQNSPVKRENTIVIDAGHGGIDGGATSCTGVLESGINLQIALRLNDLLHLLGYNTVMIRTTDTSVYTQGNTIAAQKVSDLKERVRIANATQNAILISVHQNTYSDRRYSGAQVFCANDRESQRLGEKLQASFVKYLNPGSERQCKRAEKVYLLQNITCTGVLVECGFLSNVEEEARLRNKAYQQKLCAVIVYGLTDFLRNNG